MPLRCSAMLRTLLLPALFLVLPGAARGLEPGECDPAAFDALLRHYVHDGKVDYAAWKKDGVGSLNAFLKEIGKVDLTATRGKEPRVAFLINAYNAWAIHQVLEHYPVKSAKDIPGFFDAESVAVAGIPRTLDEIEAELARIASHLVDFPYALCPAAIGGPEIASSAYTSDTLGVRLHAAASRYLKDRAPLHFDRETNVLRVPPALERHLDLLQGRPDGLLGFLADFIPLGDVVAMSSSPPKIETQEIDWSLNEVPPLPSPSGKAKKGP